MRFFKTRKMEEAYKLLQTSDLKVSELALKIGFADVASFSKAFKNIYSLNQKLYTTIKYLLGFKVMLPRKN